MRLATRRSLCEKEESGCETGLPDILFVRRRSLDMRLGYTHLFRKHQLKKHQNQSTEMQR